jgi:uncharacterized membrane protein YecN with MAPEG domain
MTTAIICTALLAALLFLLGANVSRMRGQQAKAGGPQFPTDPTDPLMIAIRAHGNASEYTPTLLVLFLLVGARSPAAVAIPLIVAATLARLVHAYALLAAGGLASLTATRVVGAAGTYLSGLALAVAAVFSL